MSIVQAVKLAMLLDTMRGSADESVADPTSQNPSHRTTARRQLTNSIISTSRANKSSEFERGHLHSADVLRIPR